MLTRRQQLRFAQPVVYLCIVHLAAVVDGPTHAMKALAVFCGLSVVVTFLARGSRTEQLGWTAATAALIALAVLEHRGWTQGASVVLVPPVLASLYFAFIFGRTLLPGRVPLITHFSVLNLGESVAERLGPYTRKLTALWTVLLMAMAGVAAALALYADFETWSWVVNVANPAVALAFFVLEHVYRTHRYSRFGPFSLIRAVRIMMRPDAWVPVNAKHSP